MEWKKLRKKLAAAVVAGTLTFSVIPTPTADAGILETVIGAGVQYAALNQQISYLDNEGRDELFQQMQEKYGVNDDPYLNARLDSIMGTLTAAIAEVDPTIYEKPYNYFVNNDTSFNAFCTLGHNISVNTGMFNMVANDDEVAVVLGHEMGHGQKNHVKAGVRDTLIAQVGAAVLTNNSALGQLAAQYASNVHMPRAKEREAAKAEELKREAEFAKATQGEAIAPAVEAPTVEPPAVEQPEQYIAFKVYGSREDLKKVVEFMRANEIRFDQIQA